MFPPEKLAGITNGQFSEWQLYDKHRTAVPGSVFVESGIGHLRCSYATSMKQIKEALAHIDSLFKEIQKEQASKIGTNS